MRSRTPRFDRAIVGSAPKHAVRVDILFNGKTIIGGEGNPGLKINAGQITFDRTAATLARGTLRVAEPTLLPTVSDGGPQSPYGYEAQIFRGVRYDNGDLELIPQCVCPIQKSSFDGSVLSGDLDLMDRSKLVIDAVFEEDYVIAAGTNTATAIRAMIDAGVPGFEYALQSTTYTTAAIVFTAGGDDRWAAARILARSMGSELYFDGYGRCCLRDEPGGSVDPVIQFADGNVTPTVGLPMMKLIPNTVTLTLDREPAFNRVIVTGENSSNDDVYRGVATDDDPSSPTFYGPPFGRKTKMVTNVAISSNEQASAVAAAYLRSVAGVARTVSFSCTPNPSIEPGIVGQVTTNALGIDELYIIDGYTLGLTADAVMGFDGVNITVGSQSVKARFVQFVTSDTITDPGDPTDPTFAILTDEDFDAGGLDGDVASTFNTSAAAWTGSGTCTLSDGQAKTGGLGLLVDGTAANYGTYGADYPTHDHHYRSPYWFHERNPSDDAWLWSVRDATDSVDAFQVGINNAGKLIGRDTGTGAIDATSTTTLAMNAWNRLTIEAGAGVVTVYAFSDPDEASTDNADAIASITFATTATGYTNDKGGLLVTIAGTGAATGDLQNESFEGGTNGAAPTTSNTTMNLWTGGGTCTFSNSNVYDGSLCLALNGSTYHIGQTNHSSHNKHYKVVRYRHTSGPTSGNAYLYELRNGANTGTAGQFGVQSDGKVRIRDGTSGTPASSASAVTTGVYYDYVLEFDPSQGTASNRYVCRAYLSGVLQFTLNSAALTATNFSHDWDGLIANTTGSVVGKLDGLKADTTAAPIGTVAVGIKGRMDRDQSRSDMMPAPLLPDVIPPPPPTTTKLEPATGIYIGATMGTVGTQGSSSPAGRTTYMGVTGNIPPHLTHIYQSGPNWNGIPTTTERNMLRPAGQMPSMPSWTWKINTSRSWADLAGGSDDAAIRTAARGLMQYGHPQMQSFFHEPENDATTLAGTAGYAASDYAAMWRHIVDVMRDEGVRDEHAVFVWNMVGYSNHVGTNGSNMAAFYPGDAWVDWIGYDPYTWSGRSGLDLTDGLINENISSTSGWPGFYAWATTPRSGFSGAKPLILCEYGPTFTNANAMTDTQGQTFFNTVRTGIQNYPRLKALQYWNSTVSGGIDPQLSGHTLSSAAYRTLVQLPYCTQIIT